MQTYEEVEERQKYMIIEFSKLGMDFYSAAVASECTPEQIERFEADLTLKNEVEFAISCREKELLDRFNTVALNNAKRGDTKALERLLEILNPNKYSKVTKLSHSLGKGKGKALSSMKIEFVGSSEDE